MVDTNRTVLNEVGEQETIWLTNYTIDDGWLIMPGFVIGFIAFTFVADWSIALGVGVFGLIFGSSVLLAWYAPNEWVSYEWIIAVVMFAFSTRTLRLHDPETDETARSLTHIDRFIETPGESNGELGAVRCSDQLIAGMLQFQSKDLTLAPDREWERVANRIGEEINTLDFPLQVYVTSRPVDADTLVEPYRERMNDPDVKQNPQLEQILSVYETGFHQQFAERDTSHHEYYVVVSVSPLDIKLHEQTGIQKLSRLRGGEFLRSLGAFRNDLDESELTQQQEQLLYDRLMTVQDGLGGISGFSAEPVDARKLSACLEEFWTGRTVPTDESFERFREVPIVIPDYQSEDIDTTTA